MKSTSRPASAVLATRFRRAVLVLTILAAGACTDGRSPVQTELGGEPRRIESLQLPGVEGTACQYGGEYPDCKPAPLPPGGEVQPTPEPEMPGPGGESMGSPGGGAPSPPEDDDECDPKVDPTCEQPLTPADTVAIKRAIAEHYRPDAEFTDSIAKRECGEMLRRFFNLLAVGYVYRGRTDSDHFGMRVGNRIHFDPSWLNAAVAGNAAALREIAITAVHESGHTLGKTHGLPNFVDGMDHYSEPYFNRLNPGPNSCVKR